MKTAKAIVAAVSAIATVGTAAFADDVLSLDETGTIISVIIVQAIGVYSVWKVRNKGYVFQTQTQQDINEITKRNYEG